MKQSAPSTHVGNPLVAPLDQFDGRDLDEAGGKGANLGELRRAGFPVPAGYVITTAAYEQFLQENSLAAMLEQAAGNGSAIRAAFEQAPIPPPVEQAIWAAQQQLGPAPVAVRSSATAEDLPEAAFAGQQDTYLNVTGGEGLLSAVRRCWASLWSDRAIAYRARLGLDQPTVKIAVVVQQMVAAEAAGVLFTANTVTGAREEMVIAANPGLGEAVVAGLVTPDHFVLRRQRGGWRIVAQRRGQREVVIQVRPGGGTEAISGAETAEMVPLPENALRQLADLGVAIQRHFGSPQDIEWAWAGGQPFILQARPITALPTPPPKVNRVQRLLAGNFAEMMPVRPYPLDIATWLPALGGAVEPIFELLGLKWSLSALFEEENGVVARLNGRLPRPTWRVLLAPLRLLGNMVRYNPVQWQADPLLAENQTRARELADRPLAALSWEELLAIIPAAQAISRQAAGEIRRRYFPRAALAVAALRLLVGLAGGSAGQVGRLLSGAENKTVEANRALEELAAQVRSDPKLAALFSTHEPAALWPALEQQTGPFVDNMRAFLERYGHRETVISTLREPTWRDEPAVILGLIKSFATQPPPLPSSRPAWEVARDELRQRPLLRLAPLRAAFLKTLTAARTLLPLREDTHFYATMPMPILRQVVLELGGRLVQAGVLERAADVFHLTLSELEQVGGKLPPPAAMTADLQAAVRQRQGERARLADTPLVDPRHLPQVAPAADALLRGLPGAPGTAEGPARILRDGSEFDKLVAGDVLVAPYTNPSWTPLFQRAAAVVVDTGSPASHAAIVAREYGIPAVMATVTGTRTLHDGEMIRVDGYQGCVFRVTIGEKAG